MTPDQLSDLEAIESRHRHVEQHEVRPFPSDKLQALFPVLRLDHFDPESAQTHRAEHPGCSVVVDEEHAGGSGPFTQSPIGLAADGVLDLSARPLQNVRRGNSISSRTTGCLGPSLYGLPTGSEAGVVSAR